MATTFRPAVALAAIGLIGFWLRTRDLGGRSLWVDELFSVGLAAQDLSTIATVLYGEEANMTLYYLVMFGWIHLVGAGASEFWMRLPSVAFGLASLWALYRLGAALDRPLTGFLAAGLGAVNAYHVAISQEARGYSLWSLWTTLSWLLLLRAMDRADRRAWLGYGVVSALTFWSHFFTVFVIAAQAMLVAARWRWSEFRGLLFSSVAAAALCSPFVPFFLGNYDGSQILHVRASGPDVLLELFRLFAGGGTLLLGAYALLGGFGLAVHGVGFWRARDPRRLSRWLVPLLWLVVPTVSVFLLSYVKPIFKERYLFGAMAAFPLLTAVGLAAIRPPLAAAAAASLVFLLSLDVAAAGLSIRQSENWRGAVQYLEENTQPADGMIFISKRGQLGYEYYGGRLTGPSPERARPEILESFDWGALAASEVYYRGLESGTSQLGNFSARHARIWVVLSHEFDSTYGGDVSAPVRDWLVRRGYAVRQRTFQNIRVLLYERRT